MEACEALQEGLGPAHPGRGNDCREGRGGVALHHLLQALRIQRVIQELLEHMGDLGPSGDAPFPAIVLVDAGQDDGIVTPQAGEDGLLLIRELLRQVQTKLRPAGAILLEIGWHQGAVVLALAREHFPAGEIQLHQDLAGLDRFVTIQL